MAVDILVLATVNLLTSYTCVAFMSKFTGIHGIPYSISVYISQAMIPEGVIYLWLVLHVHVTIVP